MESSSQLSEKQQKLRRKRMVFVPRWAIFVDYRTQREVEESRDMVNRYPMRRRKNKNYRKSQRVEAVPA